MEAYLGASDHHALLEAEVEHSLAVVDERIEQFTRFHVPNPAKFPSPSSPPSWVEKARAYRTVESEEPETMMSSSYWRQRTLPVWPVRTLEHSSVSRFHICNHAPYLIRFKARRVKVTLIVLSRRPDMILWSSYWRQ